MYIETLEETNLRGVLQTPPDDCWTLERLKPVTKLQPYVSWVWIVTWDMDNLVHKQITLPYPTANLVIEDGQCKLYGPTAQTFEKELSTQGHAVGIKFKPGGVTVLIDPPVTKTVDRVIPGSELFKTSPLLKQLEEPEPNCLRTLASVVQKLVISKLPESEDPNIRLINKAFDCIRQDSQITKVNQLAAYLHTSRRSLQRLFTSYVGLGVKAVIRRYRLQEVIVRASSNQHTDWIALAEELGYYDQSHLIAECQSTFGISPSRLKEIVCSKNEGVQCPSQSF